MKLTLKEVAAWVENQGGCEKELEIFRSCQTLDEAKKHARASRWAMWILSRNHPEEWQEEFHEWIDNSEDAVWMLRWGGKLTPATKKYLSEKFRMKPIILMESEDKCVADDCAQRQGSLYGTDKIQVVCKDKITPAKGGKNTKMRHTLIWQVILKPVF